ncbi:PREDICTED: UPF0193 protein EVG1 isoform X2 [Pseudopodoces humilis]|uniref:UPF0193 protein EVG1 isoform X2 n=1 Tax=Pseudopodoces humilis TaxID=181119 RepID=UPI0006B75714|nr:PREDICTED: UPF0193 protein EVG1 isoform X2 [Pseudopodoces humilis]
MEAAGIPGRGWGSPRGRPARYSTGTRELVRATMEELHLTHSQKRYLMDYVKRRAVPTGQPGTKAQRCDLDRSLLCPVTRVRHLGHWGLRLSCYYGLTAACQPCRLPARPLLRPAKVCQAEDAYTREKFKPQPIRDLEKEKRRLQNILATGKDEVEDKVKQVFIQKKEEEIAAPDQFEELMNEIQERREFLAEMEALGQGKKYQGIILTEISQKLHEMEIIDKKRSEEMRNMTKAFPVGNKSSLQD